MKRILKALAIICTLAMMLGSLSSYALGDGIPATPTDLNPAAQEETIPEETGEEKEPEADQEPAEETDPVEEPTPAEEAEPAEENSEEVPAAPAEVLPQETSQPDPEKPEVPETTEEPDHGQQGEESGKTEKPETEQNGEQTQEEESSGGVEIIITKTLRVRQSWDGMVKRKTPTVLKLDVTGTQKIYILLEGYNLWATVQRADRMVDNPPAHKTDPLQRRTVIELDAQAGSYLISIGPDEGSLMGRASVSFLDQDGYENWLAANPAAENEAVAEVTGEEAAEENAGETGEETAEETAEENNEEAAEETGKEAEEETAGEEAEADTETESEATAEDDQTEEETENGPESAATSEEELTEEEAETEQDAETEEIPEDTTEEEPAEVTEIPRNIHVDVTFDTPSPVIGDTAHFKATLEGYDDLAYTTQWQYSSDRETWTDLPGETADTMDVVVTEANNLYYWRIIVYLERDQVGRTV